MPKVWNVFVLAIATMSLSLGMAAQTSFRFGPVVQTGDQSPAPSQLSSVSEFSFNDSGQIAVAADGGLLFTSGGVTSIVAGFGDAAPGGGTFIFADSPSLNSQGTLVFRGEVTFPSVSGLFQFSQGQITSLIPEGTLDADGNPVFVTSAAINSAGDVAFIDAFSQAIKIFSNGSIHRVVGPGDAAPGGGSFLFFLSNIGVNQSDQIVFNAFLSSGNSGIFLASGQTITKIISQGDVLPDGGLFAFATNPSINDAGQVAFSGFSNGSLDQGLFLFSGGVLTVPVPLGTQMADGSVIDAVNTTSINNAGQIAFTALTANNNTTGNGTFLFSGSTVAVIENFGQSAPGGGVFTSGVEGNALINNSGQVLFEATQSLRGDALYLFSGNQLSRTIGQGDTIARQPRFQLPLSDGIGGADRVLFSDSTFPGGTGAYLATPKEDDEEDDNARLVANLGASAGADGVLTSLFGFAMNNSGQVAMNGSSSDGGAVLLRSSQGTLNVLNDSSSASALLPEASFPAPAINNLGEVAFNAFAPSTGTNGVFLNSAGQTRLLIDAATTLPGGGTLNFIQNLALNDQEQLAFLARPFSPLSPSGVFLLANGTLTALANDGDAAPGGGAFSLPFVTDATLGPVINSGGTVAFATALSGIPDQIFNAHGIFVFRNGTLTRIVGPGDPSPDGGTFLSADSPSINASGQVVFMAQTTASFGAFLFDNGTTVKVARAGDIVLGQSLVFVRSPKINNRGHITFTGDLPSNGSAVFVAMPVARSTTTEAPAAAGRLTVPSPLTIQIMKAREEEMLSHRRGHRNPLGLWLAQQSRKEK
jgi:hypothetical protein